MSVETQALQPVPAGAEALTLGLPHLQLAGLAWGDPGGKPLLALHGWLDNAMSFVHLGPRLAQAGYRVVALDLPGHGLSDWRPAGQPYVLMENCFDVEAAARALGWTSFTLVGHSMGASIATLLSAAHPNAIERLVLIDGLGTLTTPDEEAPAQLGRALGRWLGHLQKAEARLEQEPMPLPGKIYATLQEATEARMQGVGAVDFQAAWQLCQRALVPVAAGYQAGGWYWRSDPRLRHPSPWRLTEAHNRAFIRAIQASCLLIEARQGLLIGRPEIAERCALLSSGKKLVLQGGHHLHLEQETSDLTAEKIVGFLCTALCTALDEGET